MKIKKIYPVPKWILGKIPTGVERLNTVGCSYYGIYGLDRVKKNWKQGIFLNELMLSVDSFNDCEYIVNLSDRTYYRNR